MIPSKAARWASVVISAALIAAGCRSLGLSYFASPVITVRDVRLGGVSLSGGLLNVSIGIKNPNAYRLDARRLTYKLFVDSTELGSGGIDTSMTLRGLDSTVLKLPLQFSFLGLGAVARQLQSGSTLNYRVTGEMTVATPVGKIVRAYDQQGTFPLFGTEKTGGASAFPNR